MPSSPHCEPSERPQRARDLELFSARLFDYRRTPRLWTRAALLELVDRLDPLPSTQPSRLRSEIAALIELVESRHAAPSPSSPSPQR